MINLSNPRPERKSERLNVHQLRGYRRINEIIRLCKARLLAWGQLPNHSMLCAIWFLICDALYMRFGDNLDLETVMNTVSYRSGTHVIGNEDIALEQLRRVCDIAGNKKGPYRMTTDIVAGRRMELESLEREAASIRTMYAYDQSPNAVKARNRHVRRFDDRRAKALKRLKDGATPRTEALTRTKPWLALGISRRTWYRQGKPMPWELLDMTVDEWIKKGKPQPSTGNVVNLIDRQ
jgi:hypothetical protein